MRAGGRVVLDTQHGFMGTGQERSQRNAAPSFVAMTDRRRFQQIQGEARRAVQLHRRDDHRRVDETVPDIPKGQVPRHRGQHLDGADFDAGWRIELGSARL